MSMQMTSRSMKNQYSKEINKIWFDEYMNQPSEWDKVAHVGQFGPGNRITESDMTGFGLFEAMNEGGTVKYDVPAERDGITRRLQKAGLGFQVTMEAWKDSLHGDIRKMPAALAKAANHYKELVFWDNFNRGHDYHKSMEGGFVFGSHDLIKPLRGVTSVSNIAAVPAALSETSLAAAQEHFYDMVDETGMPANSMYKGNKLIVAPKNRHIANRLHTAEFGSTLYLGGLSAGDGAAQKNFTNPDNGFMGSWETMVSNWLTDEDSWFLIDQKNHDMRWLWKETASLRSSDDFDTDSTRYKSTMRFSTFTNKWRGLYKGN
jgi:hypothetical protein